MNRLLAPDRRVVMLRFNQDSGQFVSDKDWDQFESCSQCRGRASIDETPDGDLICQICKANLPRPDA